MIDWLRGTVQDRRQAQAARDALCDHDGTEPMCNDCQRREMRII